MVMSNVRELRPLGDALGTEALGVDLSKPLDDEIFAWIAGAFAEHPVLVFRDQNLGAGELAAFGRRFGVPRKHALVKYRHRDHEEVSWLTNIEPDGKIDWYGVKRATDWRFFANNTTNSVASSARRTSRQSDCLWDKPPICGGAFVRERRGHAKVPPPYTGGSV
jgi:alpha-ketoglutarate-dependent taurine dioxygenase